MADYRLSAQVIKRSDGKSCVAAAAYRAAERLEDHRTGEIHNYAPKGGVVHAEILAPDNTPDWMLKRQDLWNAVEKIERRKDAQLARELQLSLPHELTPAQRVELVRGFAQEQFINSGMIADIAIHTPNPRGDERNHHAHIMLTMRELTSDGFGKKNRDWNSRETALQWREEWALHQNRMLERHGHKARVDHRSLEAQGIDRQPKKHLGVTATDIERNGKRSRRGDENRAMSNREAEIAKQQAEAARLAAKITEERAKLQKEQRLEAEKQKEKSNEKAKDLKTEHERERRELEANLRAKFEARKEVEQRKMLELREKVQSARGVRKIFRDLSGMTSRDVASHNEIHASLKNIQSEERTARMNLEMKQANELKKEQERQTRLKRELEVKQEAARKQQVENKQTRKVVQQEAPQPRPKPPKGAVTPPRYKPAPVQRETPAATQSPKMTKYGAVRPEKSLRELGTDWHRSTASNDNENDKTPPRSPDRQRDREP